ncbi:hypothetical protein FACS189463_2500 [Bacteroidia bacterium]|nr:hypothetical protein FACS189463_2500 [Bacteroidia bacterium]
MDPDNPVYTQMLFLEVKPSIPQLSVEATTNPLCYGQTGSVKLRVEEDLYDNTQLQFFWGRNNDLGSRSLSDFASDNTLTLDGLAAKSDTLFIAGFDGNHEITTTSQFIVLEITQPAPITYSTTATQDVTCYQGNNGSANITASGGNGNYLLYWKKTSDANFTQTAFPANATEITVNNLIKGAYQFYVKDTNGCEKLTLENQLDIQTVVIQGPEQGVLVAVVDSLLPSGYNLPNGFVTIEAHGGTPSPSGMYQVVWRNARNQILNTHTEEMSGGQFHSTLTNITGGDYSAQITDDKGCVQNFNFHLDQPPLLTVLIEERDTIRCNGATDGQLIAHATGGVVETPYNYRWYKKEENAYILTNATDSIYRNLSAGDYRVVVTDGSREPNTASVDYRLKEPDKVLATLINVQDVSCFDSDNGKVQITVGGGNENYELLYKESADDVFQKKTISKPANVFSIDNLKAGEYQFFVSDGKQCVAYFSTNPETTSASVTINQPQKALQITSVSIHSPSGAGLSNGGITLRITGGTPNDLAPAYTVVWKDEANNILSSSYEMEGDDVLISKLANRPQGTYRVEISDKNGCSLAETYLLIEPEPLVVSLENPASILCYNEHTGTLIAHASGGVAKNAPALPYTYQWFEIKDGNTFLMENRTDSVLDNLPAGYYQVQITDNSDPANNAQSTVFQITQPALLNTQLVTHNISCFGSNDGFIHLSVTGGTGDYRLFYKQNEEAYQELAINQTDKTFYLDHLFAGSYTLYIMDGNHCYAKIENEDIHTLQLTQPDAPLSIASAIVTDVSGFGRSDGSIVIAIAGGTPPYNVEWKDGNGQRIATPENLLIGEYSVRITDSNFAGATPETNATCVVTGSYSIIQPEPLAGTIEETHFVSCFESVDGELTAHIQGGIKNPNTNELPYKYTWNQGSTDSILSNIVAGTYRLTIEDYSCTPNIITLEYELLQPGALQAAVTQTEVYCGVTTPISVEVSGGTLPYRYQWAKGDTTPVVENVGAGEYPVLITDARGCEITVTAIVSTPADLQVDAIAHHPICFEADNGWLELLVSGGEAPYTYLWDNGSTEKDLKNQPAGTYSVTVTDVHGCSFFRSFQLVDPAPLQVFIGEDRTLCNGQQLTISPTIEDLLTQFQWSGPNDFTATTPTITVREEGVYRLLITDSKGCQATDHLQITVKELDIASEIVVASQVFANDTILFVNISDPEPERSEWLFDPDPRIQLVDVQEHYAKVIFAEPGVYAVGFRTYVDECWQDDFQSITVAEADDRDLETFGESIIEEFTVYPNPSGGQFTVEVKLNKISPIRLRMFSLSQGIVVDDRRASESDRYSLSYRLAVAPGVYALVLETPSGSMNLKLIVL